MHDTKPQTEYFFYCVSMQKGIRLDIFVSIFNCIRPCTRAPCHGPCLEIVCYVTINPVRHTTPDI